MRGTAVALALTMGVSGCGIADAATTGTPGAHTAGDRLFPGLGNGGYDAQAYDVRFGYRSGTKKMNATSTMRALATQDLSSFSLDSAAQQIHAVTVNGAKATFHTLGKTEKLVITPDRALPRGVPFRVTVRYTADRGKDPVSPAYHLPGGAKWPVKSWVNTKDGFAFMGQPDRSHLFFPNNDVPGDKARFTFRITTPKGVRAVANGDLTGHDGRTYTYRTREPIPTDITQVAVGRFRPVTQRGPGGLPVRSYLPARLDTAKAEKMVRRTPGHVAWLEKTLGLRYPFERYGVLGVDSTYDGVALETATLSTFSGLSFAKMTPKQEEPIMVHELTHQYFGDAVSVRSWDDMWLSEGHATYYQMRYAAAKGWRKLGTAMRSTYKAAEQQRADSGPPGRLKKAVSLLFDTDAAGAVMLYGLRHKVGDATFRAIEKTFFTKYRNRSASTQDYIDVANRVSGQDLTPYFHAWLYGKKSPKVPGHPSW